MQLLRLIDEAGCADASSLKAGHINGLASCLMRQAGRVLAMHMQLLSVLQDPG